VDDKERVLVICTGNSARSQMAQGLFRHYGGDRIEALSAGTRPAERVHSLAVQAMAEIGIDLSEQQPKDLAQFTGQRMDWVIAVCSRAAKSCPVFPGTQGVLHWFYDDPAEAVGTDEERMNAFRAVRDDLARRIPQWLALPPEARASATDSAVRSLRDILRR
jgi:arsenate reductase (thioredoxin)